MQICKRMRRMTNLQIPLSDPSGSYTVWITLEPWVSGPSPPGDYLTSVTDVRLRRRDMNYPTVAIAIGYKWSEQSLYDGWGGETPDNIARALGNLIVARFEEIARACNSAAWWQPVTSEILSPVYHEFGNGHELWEPVPLDESSCIKGDVEAWRAEAAADVWFAFAGEHGPMVDRVREVLESFQEDENGEWILDEDGNAVEKEA